MRLHGLLSDVTYPLIAGTSVARDFVEFPSQLYEHWFEQRGRAGALRHPLPQTGEPMPAAADRRDPEGEPHLQPGLRHGGVSSPRRWSISPSTCSTMRAGSISTRLREGGARRDRHAGRDRHAPPHAAFPAMSSPATAIPPPITAISGPRRSTPTASVAFEEAGDIFAPEVAAEAQGLRLCRRQPPDAAGGLSRLPRPRPRPVAHCSPQARADGHRRLTARPEQGVHP